VEFKFEEPGFGRLAAIGKPLRQLWAPKGPSSLRIHRLKADSEVSIPEISLSSLSAARPKRKWSNMES